MDSLLCLEVLGIYATELSTLRSMSPANRCVCGYGDCCFFAVCVSVHYIFTFHRNSVLIIIIMRHARIITEALFIKSISGNWTLNTHKYITKIPLDFSYWTIDDIRNLKYSCVVHNNTLLQVASIVDRSIYRREISPRLYRSDACHYKKSVQQKVNCRWQFFVQFCHFLCHFADKIFFCD